MINIVKLLSKNVRPTSFSAFRIHSSFVKSPTPWKSCFKFFEFKEKNVHFSLLFLPMLICWHSLKIMDVSFVWYMFKIHFPTPSFLLTLFITFKYLLVYALPIFHCSLFLSISHFSLISYLLWDYSPLQDYESTIFSFKHLQLH